MPFDPEALEGEMQRAADRAWEALKNGRLAQEYAELRAIDPSMITDITPDTTDEVIYEKLLVLVREASAHNLSQAELKQRILSLGTVAIAIARQSASLAKTLAL